VTDANVQQKLPYNHIPSNLAGVHSFVPPPKGTDLTKADRETLLKHGIWVRRPDPDREPKLFAMWHRYVTEIWTEENFVPPVLEATNDTPHNLKGTLVPTPNGHMSSGGWSGVVTVGRWVGAMGMWLIPTISAPSTPAGSMGVWQSSSWVGLDGAAGQIPGTTSTDVLQTGISQNIGNPSAGQSASPAYYAWFEWAVADLAAAVDHYPYVYPVRIKSAMVSAGDEISAIVQYVTHRGPVDPNPVPGRGPHHFGGVMLTNVTTGKPLINMPLRPPPGASFAGESAEWIMECPGAAYDRSTLPKFSKVTFTNAGACDVNDAPPGANAGVALGNAAQVTFQDSYENVETSVSAGLATVTINYLAT
jgi:hypothetical protein